MDASLIKPKTGFSVKVKYIDYDKRFSGLYELIEFCAGEAIKSATGDGAVVRYRLSNKSHINATIEFKEG